MVEKFGNITPVPGKLVIGSLGSLDLPDGTPVRLPAMVLQGTQPGPTFLIHGVVHGGELIGAEVLRVLMREKLDPNKLKGTVVAIPVANPLGFQFGSRTTPSDEENLGGSFPGNNKGGTTERLAAMIWENVLKANYLLDIHGNFPPCTCFTLLNLSAGDEKTREVAAKMAEAFGLTIVYSKPMTGTTEGMGGVRGESSCALDAGIPAIAIELHDARRVSLYSVDIAVRGLINVMKRLGMLEGEIEKQPTDALYGNGSVENAGMLTANRGGILHIDKEPGKLVKGGEVIARIRNLYGDIVDEVRLPFDGYVRAFTYRYHQAVAAGDTVAYVTKDR